MSQFQFICVEYLNNNCNNYECRNYHPIDDAQIKAAKREYELKATDSMNMTKICVKFNDGQCKFNPCKFLHISINNPIPAQQYRPVDKIKNASVKLIASVERLQNKIKLLEHASQTSGILPIPQNIYTLLEHYIKQMDEITNDVENNTRKIQLN